jgi:hypothetical protein
MYSEILAIGIAILAAFVGTAIGQSPAFEVYDYGTGFTVRSASASHTVS